MPIFFFDVHDGESLTVDRDGVALDHIDEVRDQAVALLPDLARDDLPDGSRRVYAVAVRDEAGRTVYTASLTFEGAWCAVPRSIEAGAPSLADGVARQALALRALIEAATRAIDAAAAVCGSVAAPPAAALAPQAPDQHADATGWTAPNR